MVELRLSKVE